MLGYVVVHLPLLDRAIAPVIAASQALPVVAIAPIIILWFGTGLLPKVLICALIVFFPVLVTWTVGLRGIDPALIDVARIYGASRWQMLRYVEIPLALRPLLGGVRIAFTLAVTGAVIGEFVSAKPGTWLPAKQAEFLYDTPLKFVALFCLMAIAALGYAAIALLERLLLSWEEDHAPPHPAHRRRQCLDWRPACRLRFIQCDRHAECHRAAATTRAATTAAAYDKCREHDRPRHPLLPASR